MSRPNGLLTLIADLVSAALAVLVVERIHRNQAHALAQRDLRATSETFG